jgi:hypothetical protein
MATPYTFLRARLLETHSLSESEKWDMLQKMEQMGGRKPSKLLADMMEFCPTGLEQSLPFHYLFTQRLQQDLRTQLEEVEPGGGGPAGAGGQSGQAVGSECSDSVRRHRSINVRGDRNRQSHCH